MTMAGAERALAGDEAQGWAIGKVVRKPGQWLSTEMQLT